MINLLPPNEKHEIRAARSNTLLIRYNIFLIGVVVFLLAAIGIVYVYLNNTKTSSEHTIQENQAKVVGYSAVQIQAQEFRNNLTAAKQILAGEVNYSKVTIKIASLMPKGTILENLNLDTKTFGTETTLTARTKTYADALELKDSFQKSSIFSNVHFESIATSESASAYPITVSMNVTIKKEAAK